MKKLRATSFISLAIAGEAFVLPITAVRQSCLISTDGLLASSVAADADTTEAEGITLTCDDITVTVTITANDNGDVDVATNDNWPSEAAKILSKYGVCALTPPPTAASSDTTDYNNNNSGIISQSSCNEVNTAINHHLAKLHKKIGRRGIDPTGIQDGPYRFREIVCRDGCPRFDVPIPWSGTASTSTSTSSSATAASSASNEGRYTIGDFVEDEESCRRIQQFHTEVDFIVQPVVDALWEKSNSSNNDTTHNYIGDCQGGVVGGRATSAGFLINKPGSISQHWHRDGPDEGYINAFIPLVDLEESLGPTSVVPQTHLMPNVRTIDDDDDNGVSLQEITPLLKKGQILLFDYRTLHKGLGNTNNKGSGRSRTLAYAVYTWGSIVDVHNFPDALTLEYD